MKPQAHLVLIRFSAMGDVALAVPVVKALLEQNKGLKITVVTKAFFGKLFLHLPEVQVVEAHVNDQHKGIAGLWRLAKEVSQLKPDYVIDLHSVMRSYLLCGFIKLHGYDYKRFKKGRKQKKRLIRLRPQSLKSLKSTPERYASVARRYQLNVDLHHVDLKQKRLLSNSALDLIPFDFNTETIIGIAPFAAHQAKQYPLDFIAEVIRDLEQHQIKVLLFGGGTEEIKQLTQLENKHSNCFNMAGKLEFEEELNVISNLNLMLAMDSGNGHLAAMFGVKVFTIWITTLPQLGFAPFGQTKHQQFLPDLDKYPLLPLSVYGNKMISGYEDVAESIPPHSISTQLIKACS